MPVETGQYRAPSMRRRGGVGSVMLRAVAVVGLLSWALGDGKALERNHAVFALARAGGKLFAGSRSGEVGVFGRWSPAQRAERAFKLRGNDRGAPDLPGITHPLTRAAVRPRGAPLGMPQALACAPRGAGAHDRHGVLDGRGL